MARLDSLGQFLYGLGYKIDVSDLDLRKVERFLGSEIRKIERVKRTAMKRAGSIVKRQMIGAVKGTGKGYKIAGPHAALSRLHDLLHGPGHSLGPWGIASSVGIRIAVSNDMVAVGWDENKSRRRQRAIRYQFGSAARTHFQKYLTNDKSRYQLYRIVHARNPGLGDDYELPRVYSQPNRPIVDPIQENADENLADWIEGNIRSLVEQGRAGDLAAVAAGDYLKAEEDFR